MQHPLLALSVLVCLPLTWPAPFAPTLVPIPLLLQSDPGQLFNRPPRAKQQRSQKQQQQQRKPGDAGRSSNPGGGGGGGSSNTSSSTSNSGSGRAGAKGGSGAARLRPGGAAPACSGSAPSWKQVLGGLIPLAAKGHLQCPTPIVKMRAAIAALQPVRDLRPKALPIR